MGKCVVGIVFILIAPPVCAQECAHPYIAHTQTGGVYIECATESQLLARLHTIGQIALGAGNGADLASSIEGFHHGSVELNPILAPLSNHPVWFGAAKMGDTALTLHYLDALFHQHPKVALIMEYAAASGYAAVAVHNVRIAK